MDAQEIEELTQTDDIIPLRLKHASVWLVLELMQTSLDSSHYQVTCNSIQSINQSIKAAYISLLTVLINFYVYYNILDVDKHLIFYVYREERM